MPTQPAGHGALLAGTGPRNKVGTAMSELDRRALDTLVLVAGHAIHVAPDFLDPFVDESWSLLPFQEGEPRAYVEHIQAGIELATRNPASLLVFSGGQTRADAGPRSEGRSYWRIADHLLGWDPEVRARATTEEYARDSFENLLFGICRFFEVTARFPANVEVVSWRFKERRFDLHRAAIRFPAERFGFIGVNDPDDLALAESGERAAIALFTEDPYGVRLAPPGSPPGERRNHLGEKRRERNPFGRRAPYPLSCPDLAPLLAYAGSTLFEGRLPWQPDDDRDVQGG